jgi:hypothetical protein
MLFKTQKISIKLIQLHSNLDKYTKQNYKLIIAWPKVLYFKRKLTALNRLYLYYKIRQHP